MPSTSPVPRVIGTKEYEPCALVRLRPFFGGDKKCSEAYVTAGNRSVIPETGENPDLRGSLCPGATKRERPPLQPSTGSAAWAGEHGPGANGRAPSQVFCPVRRRRHGPASNARAD